MKKILCFLGYCKLKVLKRWEANFAFYTELCECERCGRKCYRSSKQLDMKRFFKEVWFTIKVTIKFAFNRGRLEDMIYEESHKEIKKSKFWIAKEEAANYDITTPGWRENWSEHFEIIIVD